MKAILMAGGSGTRLRPLTCDIPKPMVPMLNKPMAEHIINLLKKHGITDIIVTLYYLPHVIQNYFGDGSELGVNIRYAVEEKMPLGTAGCVKAIEDQLDDTFIVISGDSLTDIDLEAALAYHKEKGSQATIVLQRVDNPLEFGVVITDDQGRIRRFLEKPSSSEVFSDTINTGTYILEPQVLKLLEPDKEVDFSKDLFPQLLRRNDPMFGYIASGYWEDVGNLQAYRQAQYDALEGKVHIHMGYAEREPGIWVGENTVIDPTARLTAPVVIGHNCQIGGGAHVSAGTVIGDNVVVGNNASLKRPVIWNNVFIAEEVALRGCVIGKNTSVKRGAEVLEGAIVGNDCVVGEKSVIKPNVKVWPGKNIETGATVGSSLIWGTSAQRTLFGASGVRGLINVEISPEFAVKLGASYGATLPPNSHVVVSRDESKAARMINRAMISGLMSVGVNVMNIETTALPISRYQVPGLNVQGAIHSRLSPDVNSEIQIEFLDGAGMNISKGAEKKIESNFFKEDFRRVQIQDVGEISFPARVKEYYKDGFLKSFSGDAIRQKRPKIVVDYASSLSSVILPELLGLLGAETLVLNAHVKAKTPGPDERRAMLDQLANVVTALKADFGVQIDAHGERLAMVDNRGRILTGEALLATLTKLFCATHPGARIGVTVTGSSIIERIAAQHGGTVVRTKANPRALMEAARSEKLLFGGTDGKFIFPALHPGFDAMITTAKIAEALATLDISLSEIRSEVPEFHHLQEAVSCPWEQKGTVMRVLVEQGRNKQMELVDGVKIFTHGGWVLVLPDPVEPLVHVHADGLSLIETEQLLEEYASVISSLAAGKEEGVMA